MNVNHFFKRLMNEPRCFPTRYQYGELFSDVAVVHSQ